MAARIEDYALIGDCETAALVSRGGCIDWLCWPRMDSGACFAALLGDEDNGRWSLGPRDGAARTSRRYRGDTLILETRFETESGAALLVDFMPPRGRQSDLVRLVIGERGRVDMRTELTIRFGYGAVVPWVTRLGDGCWRAVAGPDMLILRTPAPMRGENLQSVADFTVSAGETVPFTLTYQASHLPPPPPIDEAGALAETERFWGEWAERCRYSGPHRQAVVRSLITLRALIYAPTGGIVAAPTTSLPTQPGGPRNWDYRYCWLRDATLTLLALMNSGYHEEATAWRDWLLRAVAGRPEQLQIMYGLAGERRLPEWEVPWLAGYEGARPVRVGNAAHAQLQLDVFGEVMDALHQARRAGLPHDAADWAMQRMLLRHLETVWSEPDFGMWEVRGPARHFTYSKVMAWVAFDRALRSAEDFGLEGPLERWRTLRDAIHRNVCAHGFDPGRNTFVQAYGEAPLDANLLLLPAVGFLPAADPRVQGTIAAVEKELFRDGFLLRYNTEEADDGLPPGEGAFLACSFWLADAYMLCGRRDEAEALFGRLLALRNDVGLLSEQYDVGQKRLLGNFPQAFSHVALVDTALNLGRGQKPAEQRSKASVPERR